MLINEVQYKVGLTKKSIRYYEAEGLLNPKRNNNNDYREYSEEDIKSLKLIKFLRELNIPISDIRMLKTEEISLSECMDNQLKKMDNIAKDYERIKNMCLEIKLSESSFNDIDIEKYSKEMNILNKRGITLKDFKRSDRDKIIGAVLSSLSFSLIFIFFIGLFTFLYFTEDEFPLAIYLFLIIVFGFPLLGIVINLIKRIKEIKGGEENVASKY